MSPGHLRDDGHRVEHGRRLRGPARPRLRRLYAIGAYTAAWLASPHFANYGISFNLGSVAEKGILHVVGSLTIWLVLIVAGVLTAS